MQIEKNKNVRWIDCAKPTAHDLSWLKKEFGLHPIIVDELKGPSARAHVENYDGYLFFVYYFPSYDLADASSIRTEIDFIVTKDSVVTVHYGPVAGALDKFKVAGEKSSLMLLYHILSNLILFEERQLRHIREKVEQVGQAIFKDKEREVLERLTYLKRDISEYRIVVRLQRQIFESLLTRGKDFWGDDAAVYLNDLIGDQLKVVNQIEDYRDAVADFEDTNNQLMNVKINTAMKTFTTLSFLTFPFMLVAAVFSMHTLGTPLIDNPNGFWIIVGVMAVCIISLIIYFRKKKWF